MNNVKYMIPLLALILLVPGIMNDTFAQRVNDDYTISNSTLSGLIPDDNTIGPVAVVSELHKAHSDLTGIMIDHSKGNFDVAENIVFTMVLVDEENKKLVVMIDPVLLSLGLDTSTSDIQQLFNTDVNVDLSYAVFIPESHTNPSSQSQINTWISLYNDRCSVSTTSGLCQALIFNLEMQNHYTLNSSGIWVAPSTSTPSSTPDPIIPTTPTTNTTQTILFSDDFEDGTLNKWTESGESDWRADTFDENRVPTDHSSTNKVAEADNCDTMCTLTIKNVVDIATSTDPKLEFWRYVDRSLDNTEYLKVEVTKNGATWVQLDKWNPENGDDDDTWHKETFDLSPYKFSNFKVRFVASMSSGSEDVGIDDVKITSQGSVVPSTANPVKKFYGGQQILKSQNVTTTTDIDIAPGTITIGATTTDGQVGFVTAGHVLKLDNGSPNNPVTLNGYHLYDSFVDGSDLTNDQLKILTVKLESRNPTVILDSRGDMGFVPIAESNLSVSQTQLVMRNGTLLNIVHGSTEHLPILQNIQLYGFKYNSDGIITHKNATIFSDDYGVFHNLIVGHYDSIGGDSGAPIIISENNINKIIGVHKGVVCTFSYSISDDTTNIDVESNPILCPSPRVQTYYKLFTPWENVKSNLNLR